MSPRILYVTCARNGLDGLEYLYRRRTVAAIITIPPELAKKANVSGYVDVRPFAEANRIPCIALGSYQLNKADVANLDYDVIVVNGWNRLLSAEIIASAAMGAIGVHAGHPPIGLGRAPIVWNILLGHTDIEVYAFELTARADDGNILARQTVEITNHDDVGTLYQKVSFIGSRLVDAAIDKLSEGRRGEQQDLKSARYYAKRTPEDGRIDFCLSETEIYNFVRAQTAPYPGAYSFLNGKKWIFDRVVPFDHFAFRDVKREPGRIVAALPAGPVVLTGGGPVWVQKAISENGERIPGDIEWMRSLIGLRFET